MANNKSHKSFADQVKPGVQTKARLEKSELIGPEFDLTK